MAFDLGTNTWVELHPGGMPTNPLNRFGHVGVYDSLHDRMLINGGNTDDDTWALSWGGPLVAAPEEPPAERMTFFAPRPNPSPAQVTFDFDLPTRQRARLAIHDIQGRQIAALEDAVLAPGRHSRTWDGRTATGLEAPAGLYFGRLTVGASVRQQKAVLIR